MKKITISIVVVLGLATILATGCSNFGSNPSGGELAAIKESPHYSVESGEFVNRRPDILNEMKENVSALSLIKSFFSGDENQAPSRKLPETKPDLDAFLSSSNEAKVIWFGHSTFLLNLSGTIILVDPVFSKAASPFSFLVKRFQTPVLPLDELPRVDFVLISHDHYDHLDMETVQFFSNRETKFVTPLGVGSHLTSWGIDKEKITERDWWESHTEKGVTFVSTPSQHFSGRDGINNNQTLWSSWIIQDSLHNLYFSGDSGYDTHFQTIGDRYGPFDIAFLENGQYNPLWKEVHLFPKETIQAYRDLKAKKLFPVHWGMFDLSTHSWNTPVKALVKESKGDVPLVIPRLGEIVSIDKDYSLDAWWVEKE